MNAITEIIPLTYPIKYSTKITVGPKGEIAMKKVSYVYSEETGEYEPIVGEEIFDVLLGMQYDHRVSWIEFDLDALIWGLNDIKFGAESDYVYRLYFNSLDNSNFHPYYEFDGEKFYIPSSLTHQSGQFQIILAIINKTKGSTDTHYNITRTTNETFISNTFTGTVTHSLYDPTAFIPLELNTKQRNSLIKTPVDARLADDGKMELSYITTSWSTQASIANQKDNYVTYIGFKDGNLTSKLDNFTMYMTYEYFNSIGEPVIKAVKVEKIKGRNNEAGLDTNYDYISWVPYEITQQKGFYNAMLIAFYGEYVLDESEIITDSYLSSMYQLINEEQTWNASTFNNRYNNTGRSYQVGSNSIITLNNTNPQNTIEWLESSEDYYFYCSGFIQLIVENNFLIEDVKDAGIDVSTSSYTGARTSAYSNIESSDDLILSTADNGVLFANYVETGGDEE